MSVSVWAERPRSCGSTSYGPAFSPDTFPSDTISWDTLRRYTLPRDGTGPVPVRSMQTSRVLFLMPQAANHAVVLLCAWRLFYGAVPSRGADSEEGTQ